jgi:flagellar secretion chaperone FliS
MYNAASEAYLESRVFSASPTELVHMLYVAAIEDVRDARRCLAEGDIEGRSRAIAKAMSIIVELAASLDAERGGEIARRLAALYVYMLERLADANFHQSDGLLAETLGLLSTLSEAWQPAEQASQKPEHASGDWNPAMAHESAYVSNSWTL